MEKHPSALPFYQKALENLEKSLRSSDSNLSIYYSSIDTVDDNISNFSKALLFIERTLEIGKQSLPKNHSHLQMLQQQIIDLIEET
jgi:tetratricopeptide (TPR) repeat protein